MSLLRHLLVAALLGGAALGLAGCESLDKLNPFGEKEKILPGARTPVFPEGVPGVDYGSPPPQPAGPGGYEPEAPASTPTPSGTTPAQ